MPYQLLAVPGFVNRQTVIVTVSALLLFFLAIYFIRAYRIKRAGKIESPCPIPPLSDDLPKNDILDNYHLISAQLELMDALSDVGLFTIVPGEKILLSPNAVELLGLEDLFDIDEEEFSIPLSDFCAGLNSDDRLILASVMAEAESPKNLVALDTPYVLRYTNEFGRFGSYVFRFKALYNQSAQLYAITAAFISAPSGEKN